MPIYDIKANPIPLTGIEPPRVNVQPSVGPLDFNPVIQAQNVVQNRLRLDLTKQQLDYQKAVFDAEQEAQLFSMTSNLFDNEINQISSKKQNGVSQSSGMGSNFDNYGLNPLNENHIGIIDNINTQYLDAQNKINDIVNSRSLSLPDKKREVRNILNGVKQNVFSNKEYRRYVADEQKWENFNIQLKQAQNEAIKSGRNLMLSPDYLKLVEQRNSWLKDPLSTTSVDYQTLNPSNLLIDLTDANSTIQNALQLATAQHTYSKITYSNGYPIEETGVENIPSLKDAGLERLKSNPNVMNYVKSKGISIEEYWNKLYNSSLKPAGATNYEGVSQVTSAMSRIQEQNLENQQRTKTSPYTSASKEQNTNVLKNLFPGDSADASGKRNFGEYLNQKYDLNFDNTSGYQLDNLYNRLKENPNNTFDNTFDIVETEDNITVKTKARTKDGKVIKEGENVATFTKNKRNVQSSYGNRVPNQYSLTPTYQGSNIDGNVIRENEQKGKTTLPSNRQSGTGIFSVGDFDKAYGSYQLNGETWNGFAANLLGVSIDEFKKQRPDLIASPANKQNILQFIEDNSSPQFGGETAWLKKEFDYLTEHRWKQPVNELQNILGRELTPELATYMADIANQHGRWGHVINKLNELFNKGFYDKTDDVQVIEGLKEARDWYYNSLVDSGYWSKGEADREINGRSQRVYDKIMASQVNSYKTPVKTDPVSTNATPASSASSPAKPKLIEIKNVDKSSFISEVANNVGSLSGLFKSGYSMDKVIDINGNKQNMYQALDSFRSIDKEEKNILNQIEDRKDYLAKMEEKGVLITEKQLNVELSGLVSKLDTIQYKKKQFSEAVFPFLADEYYKQNYPEQVLDRSYDAMLDVIDLQIDSSKEYSNGSLKIRKSVMKPDQYIVNDKDTGKSMTKEELKEFISKKYSYIAFELLNPEDTVKQMNEQIGTQSEQKPLSSDQWASLWTN